MSLSPNGPFVVGVCAMEAKSKSKPMTKILNRLSTLGSYIIEIFSEDTILNLAIEEWPICHFLISFFSTGFPLDKAIQYVELRKPMVVNDLKYQKLLFDRRLILFILERLGVPTLPRLIVNRTEATFDHDVQHILKTLRIKETSFLQPTVQVEQIDYDTLIIDGQTMVKPFVEKPVDGENHHIYVYFHSSQGGGCRKLFRKVANKSSEFYPEMWEIRKDGSYIYEVLKIEDERTKGDPHRNIHFIDTARSEDVKVYTLGPYQSHAETRKSPVVDGIVQRNRQGKEIRFNTDLSSFESVIAHRIVCAFKQFICGFDLLRADQSYVIDINGWSFVKNNRPYFEQCAQNLHEFFMSSFQPPMLVSYFSVVRHADRTPKLKRKWNVSLDEISKFETSYAKPSLENIKDAVQSALTRGSQEKDDPEQLNKLLMLLQQENVKVQLKKNQDHSQIILKWGGVLTHAGQDQTQCLAKKLNAYLTSKNKYLLNDFYIVSSAEPRVSQTAKLFLNGFQEISVKHYVERPDLVDRTFFPLDVTEKVRQQLTSYLASSSLASSLLHTLNEFYINLKVPSHLCHESPDQFKARWEHLANIPGLPPSKLCSLYDQLKYDFIHHASSMSSRQSQLLQQLLELAQPLFNIIAPGEYGIDSLTKQAYAQAAVPLIQDILPSLSFCRTQFYFTKESHIHTFLNLLYLHLNEFLPSPPPMFPEPLKELDYLTQITLELYAQAWTYFVRVQLCRGSLLDSTTVSSLNENHHTIEASNSIYLTEMIPLDLFLSKFEDVLYLEES